MFLGGNNNRFCNVLSKKQRDQLLLSVWVFSVKVLFSNCCVLDPGPATVKAMPFISVLWVQEMCGV